MVHVGIERMLRRPLRGIGVINLWFQTDVKLNAVVISCRNIFKRERIFPIAHVDKSKKVFLLNPTTVRLVQRKIGQKKIQSRDGNFLSVRDLICERVKNERPAVELW